MWARGKEIHERIYRLSSDVVVGLFFIEHYTNSDLKPVNYD